MLRFPALKNGQPDPTYFPIDEQVPATYRHCTTAHRKTIFLTEHMIVFILHGHKLLHFGERMLQADKGHVLLMKRGIYVMSEIVPEEDCFESLALYFTDETLQRFLVQYSLLPPGVATAAPEQLLLPANALLESFREQYLQYLQRPAEQLPAIQQLKLQELFLLLASDPFKSQALPFLQNLVHGAPADIEYIVNAHIFQPVTVEELARLSGRSLASFKRDFQARYQLSPRKWINQKRLTHANMLLQNTGKQVAEIAQECGFDNVPHFIRIFKQEYGCTPNTVRTKKAMP